MRSSRLLPVLLLTVLSYYAYSQPYASAKTFFTVDQVDGCAELTVTINVKPDLDPVAKTCQAFFMDFGDDQPDQTSTGNTCTFTHTYKNPGSYRLEVFPGGLGVANRDSIRIRVRENIKPAFDVYSCNGSKVQIKITDKTYEQYYVNFTAAQDTKDDDSLAFSQIMTRSFSYPSAGAKTITVRGKYVKSKDKCDVQTENFNAVQTLTKASLTTLSVTSPEALQLDFTPQVDTQYKLDIALNGSTQFQQFKTFYKPVAGTATEVISGLDNEKNFYCLQFRTFDPCANKSLDNASICSIRNVLTTESGKINVTWQTGSLSSAPFRIERDDGFLANAAASPYQDGTVVCLKDYCYFVTQQYGAGGPVSRSAKRCEKAFSSVIPAAVQNIATVVEPNGLVLAWDQDPAFTAGVYTVSRVLNNANFNTAGSSTVRTLKDDFYKEPSPFTYRVSYLDVCNNRSPDSRTVKPLTLTGTVTRTNRDSLRWTRYRGYGSGISGYKVRKELVGGGLTEYTITNAADTVFVNPDADSRFQQIVYRVSAIPAQPGLPVSFSDTIKVVRKPRLIIPNAFTPDNNGTNENFIIYAQFIESIDFKVFDRWGKLVSFAKDISATDPNAAVPVFTVWNGLNKASGELMPESSYVWTATFTDLLGRSFSRTGSIALILRKKP
ncbi:MAG: gliding motility-associated C-terminal domain-containing protein [Bacteroidota bacterium]